MNALIRIDDVHFSLSTLQTFGNVLHFYGVHTSKETVLPTAGGAPGLHRMLLFLQHSVPLPADALCNDVTGDSRSVLLGLADGRLMVYSWAAQVCAHILTAGRQEAARKLQGN